MKAEKRIFKRDEMVTVSQFAKALGISRRQAYNWVEWGPGNGGVLAFRFGEVKGIRIPQTEIDRKKTECRHDACR